jgi:MFS family permease
MKEKIKTAIVAKTNQQQSFSTVISPIIISVFAIYLTIGMTLGILPNYIRYNLKGSTLMVGVIVGLQSLATLLTRAYAGKITDTKGAKHSNHTGALLIILAAISYLIYTLLNEHLEFALCLIILARIIHGASESLAITGALTWGIGLVGPEKSGKVMTWNGIAMYAGIAIGAPVAIWMKDTLNADAVFTTIILLSVVSWLCTAKLPSIPFYPMQIRTPFYNVIRLIAGQGMALAFSSIGFACISSFISLLFGLRNWHNPSNAFFAFGGFYIITRILCSSFPDRFGGYKIATISLVIEITGQLLVGTACSEATAILGCGLTGIGFSLIFPSLGVIAIKNVTPKMRGTALSAYAAFFDLSLGLAGPAAGIVAGWFNYQTVYIFGALSGLIAILIVFLNSRKKISAV